MEEANRDAAIIEMTRKLTYIRNILSDDETESTEELKKLMEGFYNPVSTISTNIASTIPDTSLFETSTTIGPRMIQPKSFDGLSNEELEVIKRNQIANTPQNINTILIDPLKAVETVQDDVINLLEKFNNKEKDKYLNRQFYDPTNRGSYLTNSLTDRIQDKSIDNLSYYKNTSYGSDILGNSTNYPNIIPPKQKIQSILENKEYRKINNNKKTSNIEGLKILLINQKTTIRNTQCC